MPLQMKDIEVGIMDADRGDFATGVQLNTVFAKYDIKDAEVQIPIILHTVGKREFMSFAGIGKGVWGDSPEEIDASIHEIHSSWTR